jgi:FAD synthase
MVDDAHTRGVPSAVITFFPHPRIVLGRSPALYLTLPEEKAKQIELLGVDILVVMAFTKETIQMPAIEFVRLMVEHLRLVSLWIGPDFALGNRRQGDAAYLKEQGDAYGFAVNVLSPVSAGTEMVSSTRIRAALSRGDMREVNLCLGRPFQVIGSLVGAKTVQVPEQHELPMAGVYPVCVCGEPDRVTIADGSGPRLMTLENAPRCQRRVPNHIVIDFTG